MQPWLCHFSGLVVFQLDRSSVPVVFQPFGAVLVIPKPGSTHFATSRFSREDPRLAQVALLINLITCSTCLNLAQNGKPSQGSERQRFPISSAVRSARARGRSAEFLALTVWKSSSPAGCPNES